MPALDPRAAALGLCAPALDLRPRAPGAREQLQKLAAGSLCMVRLVRPPVLSVLVRAGKPTPEACGTGVAGGRRLRLGALGRVGPRCSLTSTARWTKKFWKHRCSSCATGSSASTTLGAGGVVGEKAKLPARSLEVRYGESGSCRLFCWTSCRCCRCCRTICRSCLHEGALGLCGGSAGGRPGAGDRA